MSRYDEDAQALALAARLHLWLIPFDGQWYAGKLATVSSATDFSMGIVSVAFRCLEPAATPLQSVRMAQNALAAHEPAVAPLRAIRSDVALCVIWEGSPDDALLQRRMLQHLEDNAIKPHWGLEAGVRFIAVASDVAGHAASLVSSDIINWHSEHD